MKSLYRLMFVLMSLFMTSSCVATHLSEQKKESLKKVAVTGKINDYMHNRRIGITIFGNHYGEMMHENDDVFTFAVDGIVDTLNEYLADSGAAFEEMEDIEDNTPPSIFSSMTGEGPTEEEMTSFLKQAKAQGYDTALVLSPGRDDEDPRLPRGGYGIHSQSTGVSERTCVYFLFSLYAYDTASGDVVASSSLKSNPYKTGCLERGQLFSIEAAVDTVSYKENSDAYTDAEKAAVIKIIQDNLEVEIPLALQKMGFLPGYEGPTLTDILMM